MGCNNATKEWTWADGSPMDYLPSSLEDSGVKYSLLWNFIISGLNLWVSALYRDCQLHCSVYLWSDGHWHVCEFFSSFFVFFFVNKNRSQGVPKMSITSIFSALLNCLHFLHPLKMDARALKMIVRMECAIRCVCSNNSFEFSIIFLLDRNYRSKLARRSKNVQEFRCEPSFHS